MGEAQWVLCYYYDEKGQHIGQWIQYETYYNDDVKSWVSRKIGEGEKKVIKDNENKR